MIHFYTALHYAIRKCCNNIALRKEFQKYTNYNLGTDLSFMLSLKAWSHQKFCLLFYTVLKMVELKKNCKLCTRQNNLSCNIAYSCSAVSQHNTSI